jgi:hypothetical protein
MTYSEPIQLNSRPLLTLMNQLCELEQKTNKMTDGEALQRHIARMKDAFKELHLVYEFPLGQTFDETRTDVEAHISGPSTDHLQIVEVLKPIIRFVVSGTSRVIQKGIVVVSGKKE